MSYKQIEVNGEEKLVDYNECLCGYICIKDESIFLKGDEDFIEIESSLYRKVKLNYGADELRKVKTISCPKCGNLMLESFY